VKQNVDHEFLTIEHCRGKTAFILTDEASYWERGGLEVACQCVRRVQGRALDQEKEGSAFKIGRFGPRQVELGVVARSL
jgi:hypothetical protein